MALSWTCWTGVSRYEIMAKLPFDIQPGTHRVEVCMVKDRARDDDDDDDSDDRRSLQ